MGILHIDPPSISNYQVRNDSPQVVPNSNQRRIRVLEQARKLGVRRLGFMFSEIKYLPKLIHPREQLGGVVQGRSKDGHVMLAATNKRIIFLDTKPMYIRSEDISYDSVAALTLEWVGMSGTLILHTKLGDFKLKVTNRQTAEIFRSFVESRCLERNQFTKP